MEPSTNTYGPAQLVLTASIARRYYVDGRSKVEIADEFRLSRFKVARLLDLARSSGMVRIEISHPGSIDLDLSARLQETLGLRRAIVVDTPRRIPPRCGSSSARRPPTCSPRSSPPRTCSGWRGPGPSPR